MTETYQRLIEELNEVRQQWRAKLFLRGLLLAAACTAAALLVTVAVDNLWKAPTAGRVALAVVVWAVLAGSVTEFIVRRYRQRRRDDFFAVMVEQEHPELRNLLVNALQLGRAGGPGSQRLIEAIVKDAASSTATIEMADCLDRRQVQRALMLAGGVALLVGLYAAVFTPRFVNGVARVLLPAADIPPYTATQVVESSIQPGNTRLPESATVNIKATVEGEIPDVARVLRRSEGKSWQPLTMPPVQSKWGGFAVTLPQATDTFDYYVAAGDGRSRTYHVEVVKRPQIAHLSVAYQLPPCAARPPQPAAESNGELTGIAGTTVTLEVKATKSLREATLVTENGLVVALEKTGDDRTWRGSAVLWSSEAHGGEQIAGARVLSPTRYHLRLLDTDGFENAEPLWHTITLLRDQPPSVTIITPGRDLQAKPDEVVKLVVEATDDFGIGEGQILYRINDEPSPRTLASFRQSPFAFEWKLAEAGLPSGTLVQYWAAVSDRNDITGPGRAESRRFSLYIVSPQDATARLETHLGDYAQVLEELVRMQRENRAQTASGVEFPTLVTREVQIRTLAGKLARAMEQGAVPLATMVRELDELQAGLMAEAVKLLENRQREPSLPVQDKIIEQLQAMLVRLQRNEQAREALRKLEKTDKPAHQKITETLTKLSGELGRLLGEEREIAGKFERLPKRPVDEYNQEALEALKNLADFERKFREWAEGKVTELAKMPAGFVDDFGLRADMKRIYEEIEKAAERRKVEKMEVAVEDIGDPWNKSPLTRMKEDLDVWMPDVPDYLKWVLEEPYAKMEMPEMPLPDELQDMMGDLVQKEEEFDQEAEDITSAWVLNLDQAGWLAVDGNESNFSAKGITANDLPNSNELTGRSGDGRRGKSAGQMVGDTSRALAGRKTPARVGAERYEPGKLKQEGQDDPQGVTGGGKKAGAGQRGLQGGTPPDFVKDMERLSEKQALIREHAERVAQKLELSGVRSRPLSESIQLMKSIERDYRDLRYEDAARRRRVALSALDAARDATLDPTGVQLSRARQLPAAMRQELLQAADEGYPAGYEDMLKSYFRALSETAK